jgi:predicted Co/Zn/Cd cation transporter (cation efflux family)
MDEKKRINTEKGILKVSMAGVVFFIIVEGYMALITSSQSILMDAIYGAADLLMIVISVKIIPLLYRPTSEKHPFGFSQMEAIFITIKGAMLTAVTIGLVMNNIQIMLKGGNHVPFTKIAIFELVAGVICCLILILIVKSNKKLGSSLVQAEIVAWTIDAVASMGLAVAFILPSLIHTDWMKNFAPYLDQVVAITLSALILPLPVKTAISGLKDLFLLSPDEKTVTIIKEIGQGVLNRYPIEQTMYDVIKTGRKIWISIYFKSNNDLISVLMIQKARSELEQEFRKEFSDVYVELIPEF